MYLSNDVCSQWGLIINKTQVFVTVTLTMSYISKYTVVATDWSSTDFSPYAWAVGVQFNTNTLTHFTVEFANHSPRGFGYITMGF